ncbi:uncharacterized protein LOC126761937 [Bactrocera neohumeralis]|uniref:uncharacterized protein LOC120778583 n=1 Tax=Bactrocera tryoni TaxID=59916 RepID=UPI001A99B095|nr:uncharacterized protein LOC120778583 [Bactrocera tryoni]XP_050334330.1 uncharacterized protein LOC126761937 [Bactrocera neohumeralis]
MKSHKMCSQNIHFCSIQLTVITCTLLATMLLQHAAAAPDFVSHKACNDAAPGTIVANPGNCSQYIICNGLRSTLGECAANTYFNPNVLSCDKTSVACSGNYSSTVVTATTTTVGATAYTSTTVNATGASPASTFLFTTRRPLNTYTRPLSNNRPGSPSLTTASAPTYGRPVCTSWYDQQFPHPNNCEYYFHCVGGFLSVRRCYFGFGWDLDRQQCVPMQQAKCFRPRLVR